MKRWCFVLVTMVLLLTSCKVTTQTPPVGDGFRCSVGIRYDGTEVSGVLDRTQQDNTTLTVTQPQEIEGLTMAWDGQALTLSYAGLSLDVEAERVPAGAAVGVLCDVLDLAVKQSAQGDNSAVINGNSTCGEYEIQFDSETGYPLSLEVPALDLSVSFADWEAN